MFGPASDSFRLAPGRQCDAIQVETAVDAITSLLLFLVYERSQQPPFVAALVSFIDRVRCRGLATWATHEASQVAGPSANAKEQAGDAIT
jgi:hypothetical protein